MSSITLPNGDNVTFRDPAAVKERDRRKIKGAILRLNDSTRNNLQVAAEKGEAPTPDMFTAEDLAIVEDANDVAILALIESWTRTVDIANFGASIIDVAPTADALLDLDGPSYDALNAAATPHIEALSVSFEPTAPGAETPTEPVSA